MSGASSSSAAPNTEAQWEAVIIGLGVGLENPKQRLESPVRDAQRLAETVKKCGLCSDPILVTDDVRLQSKSDIQNALSRAVQKMKTGSKHCLTGAEGSQETPEREREWFQSMKNLPEAFLVEVFEACKRFEHHDAFAVREMLDEIGRCYQDGTPRVGNMLRLEEEIKPIWEQDPEVDLTYWFCCEKLGLSGGQADDLATCIYNGLRQVVQFVRFLADELPPILLLNVRGVRPLVLNWLKRTEQHQHLKEWQLRTVYRGKDLGDDEWVQETYSLRYLICQDWTQWDDPELVNAVMKTVLQLPKKRRGCEFLEGRVGAELAYLYKAMNATMNVPQVDTIRELLQTSTLSPRALVRRLVTAFLELQTVEPKQEQLKMQPEDVPEGAASRHFRERVETRWWNAQVQLAKSFVDQHVAAFFGLDVGGHEEEQEAFARQMLLWAISHYQVVNILITGERRDEVLRDVLQQARYIEGHHLMHSRTAHTVVSQADRRMLEGPMSSMIANLETSEVRSEDATSAAVAHTEMTREGNPVQEFMVLMSRHGIPDEQALELFADLRRGGFIADRYFSEEEDVSGDEDRRHQATPGESEFYLGASFSRRNPSMPEDLLDFHDEEEASERRAKVLRDVLQQARYIEGHHLMHSRTAHTVVSQADRRMLEGPMSSMIANLETSEVRSEDAISTSVVHTEMTREGAAEQEFMVLMSRHGIPDQQALELFESMHGMGFLADRYFSEEEDVASSNSWVVV
ncbi:unnamed protein product [Durusdinium trenchii]|uniref:Nuclear pore complex protein n=1 Tax=Durusdinium trenchii TaxID=1381693 RepID=A0ABP0ST64_9DINO